MQGTLDYVLRHLQKLSQAQEARDLTDAELLERFRRCREEAAFTILLHRHGPMVLAVCRRLLHDPHAAEDAFQATFVVLVRKANSIRKHASLASWLYGVAQRVAARARVQAARQRSRERRAPVMSHEPPLDETTWQELQAVLDEEMGQLPERYRAPLVLCYLEGQTQEHAARELGCPRTSLASRLARARELLRERLVRRNLTLSAGLLATALTERMSEAAVSALLTLATVRAAMLTASGRGTTGVLSRQT
jgi:RNA polymerase sigma factor (sigma-70 family)